MSHMMVRNGSKSDLDYRIEWLEFAIKTNIDLAEECLKRSKKLSAIWHISKADAYYGELKGEYEFDETIYSPKIKNDLAIQSGIIKSIIKKIGLDKQREDLEYFKIPI